MELLSFTIAAGETKRFEMAGRYIEIISAPAALNIGLLGVGGVQAAGMRGALAGFYAAREFGAIEVMNPAAVAQSVTLMISDGTGGSRRTPGVVTVVDSNKADSIALKAFAMVGSLTAAAGQLARMGVWNPLGSGVRAVIERCAFSTAGAATSFYIGRTNVAPATLDLVSFDNKRLGGPAPAQLRRGSDSSVSPAQNTMYVADGTAGVLTLKTPIIVPPGWGFFVINLAVAGQLSAGMDLQEEVDV